MDKITPADNLKDLFVRTQSGVIGVVFIEPSEVEAIATTAEGARTAPARF